MSGRGRTLVKAICGLVGATSVVPQVGFNVDPIVFAPVEDALMDILTPQDGGVGSDILLFLGAAAEQAASVSKSLFQSALRTNWWPLLFVLLLVCCGLALAYAASVKAMWKDLSARVALVRAELLLVRSVRDALRNELDRRTLEITHVTRKFMRLEPALEKARDDGALARTNLGLYQALVQQQDQEIQRLEADATDSANAIVTRDEAIRQLQCEIARLTAEHRAEVLPPSEPSAAVAKSEAPASASLDLLPHQSPGLDVPAPSAAQSAPEPESLVTGSNAPSGTHGTLFYSAQSLQVRQLIVHRPGLRSISGCVIFLRRAFNRSETACSTCRFRRRLEIILCHCTRKGSGRTRATAGRAGRSSSGRKAYRHPAKRFPASDERNVPPSDDRGK